MIEYLDKLKRFLQSSDALIVVTGDHDDSKTALLSQIVVQMRIARPIICFQASKHLKPDQLLKILSKHWSPVPRDLKLNLQGQLEAFLSSLIEHEQSCVLVIDDAHLLPFSILAAITHLALEQEQRVHLHIILAGGRVLLNKLKRVYTKDIPQEIILNEAVPVLAAPIQKTSSLWSRHAVKLVAILGIVVVFTYLSSAEHYQPHSQAVTTNPMHLAAQVIKVHPEEMNNLLLATSVKQKPSLVLSHQHVLDQLTALERYTLQLMGRNNKRDLQKFVEANHLTDTQIVHTLYQNKDWYILVYGHYKTDAAATDAMQKLPHSLKQLQPWIRPVKTIHPVFHPN